MYYDERGGNAHGIPVRVIGLEKDDFGVPSGGTARFAQDTGLDVVLDDSDHVALHQFFPSNRGEGTNNSDFVLLNGVEGSMSHESWEVLHVESRRVSIQSIRDKIDSIEPASVPALPPTLMNPRVIDGHFVFEITGAAGQSATVQISNDGLQWDVLGEVKLAEVPVTFTEPVPNDSSHLLFRAVIP